MNEEWEVKTLDDLTLPDSPITYGVVKPGREDANGILFIRGGDIADGEINVDQLRTITEAVSADYKRTILHGGELVISLVGNPGQVAIVPSSLAGANIARQVGLMRLRFDVDKQYIKYFLMSSEGQNALDGQSMGSVQQVINLRDLKKVKIPLPPLPEQKAIAQVLAGFDDKIELNRRMNATLEAMAQTLFRAWFVDFEPVKAKAAGVSPAAMDAETAALFPDSFAASTCGPIPTGWEVKKLDEAFEINPSRRNPGSTYLDMANVATQGHRPLGWTQREPKSGMKFKNGDTLLARITPCLENGKTAFVDFLKEDEIAWGSTEFVVLNPKPPLPDYFAYLLCRHEDFRNFAIQSMTGTSGRQRIQNSSLSNFLLAIPSQAICEKFAEIIAPSIAKIAKNSEQSQTLAQMRDALLPRLISGTVRVPEALQVLAA